MVDQWIVDMEDEALSSLKGSYGWREGTAPGAVPLPLPQGCPRCHHTWHGVPCIAKVSAGPTPECGCPTALDDDRGTLAPHQ